MLDVTAHLPADETTTAPSTSLAADVRALLRNPQTLLTVVWPVVTYLLGFGMATAL
ncbi:hypothetical protein [Geodermatophilus sp. SYSU D01176]